jgi:hypothetical protein
VYLLLMSYLVSLFILQFSVFADDGLAQLVQAAGQLIQPLLHTQQQIPAQYHREAEVADSAEDLFGIHSRYASTVTVTTLMRASTNSFSPRPPLVSTPASIILAAAACASAKVTSSRGSAMLKVFLAPSLLVKMSSKVFSMFILLYIRFLFEILGYSALSSSAFSVT